MSGVGWMPGMAGGAVRMTRLGRGSHCGAGSGGQRANSHWIVDWESSSRAIVCLWLAARAESPLMWRTLFLLTVLSGSVAMGEEFRFHADHVLGTSQDLVVDAADARSAQRFDDAVTAEVERLRKILSTYDSQSEISRLRLNEPAKASPELAMVLSLYDRWEQQTDGAFCGRLGELVALWKQAGRDDRLPTGQQIAEAVQRERAAAWRIGPDGQITRIHDVALNLDAIGKAYILDRALAAATAACPEVKRAMLNIGGEIACSGRWTIQVADPARSADNQPGLVMLEIENQGVSTSAGYARRVVIQGKTYSHILDPRTGWPADAKRAATVLAADCSTANGLSTALCVLPADRAMALVEQTAGVSALMTDENGQSRASSRWTGKLAAAPTFLAATATPATSATGNPNWPAGFGVQVTLTVPVIQGRKRAKRPYVVIWVADSKGAMVRTLSIWGRESKYWKNLDAWWTQAAEMRQQLASVSRATRAPGEYRLAWDGKNDAGNFVPAGAYTVNVESARENGGHEQLACSIDCKQRAAVVKGTGKREVGDVKVEFGGQP